MEVVNGPTYGCCCGYTSMYTDIFSLVGLHTYACIPTYLDVRLIVAEFHEAVVKAAELVDFLLVLIPHLLERSHMHAMQAGRQASARASRGIQGGHTYYNKQYILYSTYGTCSKSKSPNDKNEKQSTACPNEAVRQPGWSRRR